LSGGHRTKELARKEKADMNLRTFTAQALLLGLLHFSLGSAGMNLRAAPPANELKQRIEQFGVGTELKLKLNGGDNVRGRVESIGNESFLLATNDNAAPREIAYNQLQNMRYPKRGYKAE
jgi:hypothetical protein